MSEAAWSLRPAQQGDAWAIRRIIWRMGLNPTSLDWHHFVVAVDAGNRLIGCGQVHRHSDGSLELASMAVEPAWRGYGIARHIMERLLEGSPRPLYLRCAPEMQIFYEKFGFAVVPGEEMPRAFRRMWRMLAWLGERLGRGPLLLVMRLG